MDVIYAHVCCDDLDLDARSQRVGKSQIISVACKATKQAISIKLATTVSHFLRDLDHDFANGYTA